MKLLWSSLLVILPLFLASCDKKEKLPGVREPLQGIVGSYILEPVSPSERAAIVQVPAARSISRYVSACGNDQRLAINHKMNQNPRQLWKTSVGSGPVLTDPIAFGGNIYLVDANGILFCVSQQDGKVIWQKMVAKQPDDGLFSGGITAENDIIYIGTNIGTVIAFDAKTQKEIWKKELKFPIKGAPLHVSGKIIVTTINNQTMALSSGNGDVVWTKTVNQEQTIMCEASTPAVIGNSIICAYSSGDVMALNLPNGSDIWSDVLFPGNLADSGSVIAHITAAPVVWKDFVLVSMSEDRMALIDAITGIRIWDQEVGTISTPAVVDGWAFVLRSDGTVVCISLKTGHLKWMANIGSMCIDKNNKPIEAKWSGPIVVNGDIVVVNDAGYLIALDVSTGKLKKQQFFKDARMARSPMVIDGKLFALTERADLYAIG
ncbi:MAG: PQQ-binding-like beta-propeller repeat protein [Holosporales bacterium]|jgi:outer membrane protein assembly factor BamB|nr:PQQ-binding-like beta-propeller repeat protein [Holosporales bacterium]